MKLNRIEKGIYNVESRRGRLTPYIYIQSSGQIRFSSLFVHEMNIKGGENFDFFTDESNSNFFFKIHDDGLFNIQKHHRKRKQGDKIKENDEYISQSMGFRLAIEKAHPNIKKSAIKLVSVRFNKEADAFKLEILPPSKHKKKSNA